MASISTLEAVQVVQQAISLYKKIRHAPEEIATIGRRMEDLDFYLAELKLLLDDKRRHSLANLRPQQTQRLQSIVGDIRTDAEDVAEILEIWNRAGSLARVFFPIGRNPRKLEGLTSSVEQRKQDLRDILQLMGLFATGPLLANPQASALPLRPRSPAGMDYGVTFIDPHNMGRSRVAEGYIKLVREWTIRTGGIWRIKFAHSAGMRVRDKSDCVDILQSTNFKRPVGVSDGNRVPNETSMASLFDNESFDYPAKAGIEDFITKVCNAATSDQNRLQRKE